LSSTINTFNTLILGSFIAEPGLAVQNDLRDYSTKEVLHLMNTFKKI